MDTSFRPRRLVLWAKVEGDALPGCCVSDCCNRSERWKERCTRHETNAERLACLEGCDPFCTLATMLGELA